jgi:Zn-dependent protease
LTAGAAVCRGCGGEIAPSLLSCPACHRLVHADTLKGLAADAERAAAAGDPTGALRAWREALDLLPPGSRQHQAVSEKVQALSAQIGPSPAQMGSPPAAIPETGGSHRPQVLKRAGPLGVVALLLWKFKFALAFVLTKGKLLLIGLTKATTLLSMLLSLGVYWAAWGWKFALGVVVSIYIHEMGHVAQLERFGIKASAPMFIPGFGALVRLKQHPASEAEDASVGLAGPLWGLGASLAAYGVFLVTALGIWAAIAQWSARINLFNLLPIWQLDGGRGFHALSRGQRWIVVSAIGLAWFVTHEGLLGLLLIGATFTAAVGKPAQRPHGAALGKYLFLLGALSGLSAVRVPLP